MSEEMRVDRVWRYKPTAQSLGISTKTLQRLVARGEIATVHITDRIRGITESELRRFIESRTGAFPACSAFLAFSIASAAFPAVPRIVRPIRQWQPRTDDDERIRNAIAHINADDRDIWLRIGMALKSHYGEAVRDLWDQWSRQSKKFDEAMQNRTWRSLRGSGVNIATIFYYGRRGVA